MQKRIVPFLIVLMSLSLLGIIIIQYRWIKNALNEKQSLINNQVQVMLSNVEEQLSDLKGVNLIRNRIDTMKTIDSLTFSRSTSYSITSRGDSVSSVKIGVFKGVDQSNQLNFVEEYVNISDSITDFGIEDDVQSIIRLIKKVSVEKSDNEADIRIDSTNISKILEREFVNLDKIKVDNWGVFDNSAQVYVVKPTSTNNISFKKNLFSTDLLSPNRYQLQVDVNTEQLVWNDIKVMILLSVLFLAIMASVFAFSIRLLLKHKRISEIKSDFINNMTHEFKTPLSSISLAADSMVHPNTLKTESNLRQYVNLIQSERKKLDRHVERILEVGALKKDALKVDLQSVDLKDAILQAIQYLKLIIEKSEADLSLNLTERISVNAHPVHLKSVFVNIIENAIKYSEGHPKIRIETNPKDHRATIRIIDQGMGMSTNDVKQAFNDFYRVESGNIHKTKGFGLGLSYCKLILEKMGGEIDLKSRLGKGTEVSIKLNVV